MSEIIFGIKYGYKDSRNDTIFIPVKIKESLVYYSIHGGGEIIETSCFINIFLKALKPLIKKVRNTKLSRKMYSDYEIEGDFLIVKIT